MDSLLEHAKREMALAGLYDKDADYDGMVAAQVERLVKVMSGHGHSGGSHAMTLAVFNEVIKHKNLSPITDDPATWHKVDKSMWQSRRNHSIFSRDGGGFWYDLKEPNVIHESVRANDA